MSAKQTFLIGTAVKITTTVSRESPTSVTISITDPVSTAKVTLADMTPDTTTVYSYIYQSATTDTEGIYIATIRATYGAYTSLVQETFTLNDIDT